jgi:MFS family permease
MKGGLDNFSKSVALLRQPAFRRYIIGSLISDSGTWMQLMAQSWVVSGLTNKALLTGLVTFCTGLPTLLLAPIGGSSADRFDKRKILIATQVAQIIFAVILGWLVLTHRVQIWQVMIFGGLLGVAVAFEMPAISALVPELVKREEIAAAVGLDRAVFHGSRLIGSASGGLLITAWGAASAFFVNAFTFVALVIALITLPKLTVARERRLKFMSFNVLGIAAGLFCMSQSSSFLLTALSMGVIAITLSMNFGLANTIVQEQAPPALRGRVSAVFGMSFFGLMPLAGIVVPGFADLVGMRLAMAVASLIYGAGAFTVLSLAGRHVCDRPVAPVEPQAAPVA